MMKSSLILNLIVVLCLTSLANAKDNAYYNYKESVPVVANNQAPQEPLSLWYKRPAAVWEDALPIGNGRLGAMVYGGVSRERITLNEDTVWAGPPVPEVKENVRSTIDKVRELLFAGKYAEAQKLQQSIMQGRISPRSYQPLAEMILDFGHKEKCNRLPSRLESRYRHRNHALSDQGSQLCSGSLCQRCRRYNRRSHCGRPAGSIVFLDGR